MTPRQFLIEWSTADGGPFDLVPVEGLPFEISILGETFHFFAHLDPLGRAVCSHANSGKRVCFLDRVDVTHAEREVWGIAQQYGIPVFVHVLRKG